MKTTPNYRGKKWWVHYILFVTNNYSKNIYQCWLLLLVCYFISGTWIIFMCYFRIHQTYWTSVEYILEIHNTIFELIFIYYYIVFEPTFISEYILHDMQGKFLQQVIISITKLFTIKHRSMGEWTRLLTIFYRSYFALNVCTSIYWSHHISLTTHLIFYFLLIF